MNDIPAVALPDLQPQNYLQICVQDTLAGPHEGRMHGQNWRLKMIKMSLFLKRRPDLTFQEFSDYWMNTHWPIVQTVPAVKEHTIRYVQQHSVGGVPEGMPGAPFDGYAEAWFDKLEDVGKVVGSPEWASVVQKDDLNFLDVSKTQLLFTEEKVDFTR